MIRATTRLRRIVTTMLNEVYNYVYDMRRQLTLPRREAADLAWASKTPMLACAPQLRTYDILHVRPGAHGNVPRSRTAVNEAHHTKSKRANTFAISRLVKLT